MVKDREIFGQAIYPTYFKDAYPIDYTQWTIRKFTDIDKGDGMVTSSDYMTYTST